MTLEDRRWWCRKLGMGAGPLIDAVNKQWAAELIPALTPDQKLHSFAVKDAQKGVSLVSPARIFLP
jgi:hypothetical protein